MKTACYMLHRILTMYLTSTTQLLIAVIHSYPYHNAHNFLIVHFTHFSLYHLENILCA